MTALDLGRATVVRQAVRLVGLGILALTVALPGQPAAAEATAHAVGIEAAGTSFKVTLSDGRVLRSPELVGAVLVAAMGEATLRLRIDAVERDPRDKRPDAPVEDAVWLHSFSVAGPDGSWGNLCQAGPDGRTQGFPLAGRARRDATLEPAEAGVFEIVCSAGAQAKCVRFGYRPWSSAPDGAALLPTYNACVYMVRGDYAGDDRPKTRNGMLIDIFDDRGIQTSDLDPGLAFEAGWAPDGAVCVHHPRVPENVTLEALEGEVPRLVGRTGAVCTEEYARAHGAVIFNRSRP
jgi:hypothetical protein